VESQKDNQTINTSIINPVDYYNIYHVQSAFEEMLKTKNVRMTSIDSFAYVKNKADEVSRMIVIENNYFVAKMDNGLDMNINEKYTPFMMLQKFVFKNNFYIAMYYVMHKYMKIQNNYIRVGTKYYKNIPKTDRYNVERTELKLWDKSIIVDDHGKKYVDDIEKYDDFTIEPDNRNYQSVIRNNYNVYSPFSHVPVDKNDYMGPIGWHWTGLLLSHIFGEQYELGLKYMKVLYDYPKQVLPILVLVSKERQTGKTTFVDWLSVLFGANMVIINPQDIANSFNGAYADKNIMAVEESKFKDLQAIEKLKNLSTQKKILVNSKFIQQYSIPFYGKLIINSNDEEKFSKVDNTEIRYWVRKIPSLVNKANHQILQDLTSEIPQFLYYLDTLPPIDFTKSRMIFEATELVTDALKVVKKSSLPALHKDLEILLDDYALMNTSVERFKFTAITIKQKWFANNARIELNYINKILKISMELKRGKMQRFKPLESDCYLGQSISGRPYIYENKYFEGTKTVEYDSI